MIKILVVVPYLELQEQFDKVISQYDLDGFSISTTHFVGTDSKLIESLDADIAVARGITASAIASQKPSIHVVPIIMDSGDLFEALAKVKQRFDTCRIGIVINEELCGEDIISSLIEYPVSVCRVHDQDDVQRAVFELKAKGCKVFVGGLTLCRICQNNGLEYEHVKTGNQAIIHSVEDAVAAARSLDRVKTRGNLLLTLLNNAKDAMLAVNSSGVVIAGNRQAASLFACTPLEGKPIEAVYKGIKWSQSLASVSSREELQAIGGQQILVSQQPIQVDSQPFGVLFTFQNAEAIRKSEHKIRTELHRKGLVARYRFENIVTQNAHMLQLVEKAKRFSLVDSPILLLGETGTGKELFAQSIHNASPRSHEPFVAVNCAALPEQLLESELFGYSEGAFTGASKGGKSGLFELAHKGTLFLDEIGEIPLVLQAKLLRVLQEKEVRKIGADMVVPVDVRVISAANSNIIEKVKTGRFRLDLFYRISLLNIQLIPLRERKDDIGLLFTHFVRQYSLKNNHRVPAVNEEAFGELKRFFWPGNVRELRNAAERLAILNSVEFVGREEIEQLDIGATSLYAEDVVPLQKRKKVEENVSSPEDQYRAFIASGLSRDAFARKIGVSRTTLWRRFSQFELE
ncbi:transcriptional regulator containing PAS, AAA-type ATPase, and DNA-binding domains [Sphaerochaeta pleomorpha str. Grapes]|uniref:Transcriptional regulator containing PAS, AAA-type ATPase, and DNA-binding domains n=1 Tax=Sphaerochaeta pleomorpha (strain ATCC BAA-1885 / DSM 22778 / Grapes) TaxID=158190 RepID=G8QQE8_SPHPG|nr:sigma 54-interacting transcriptional regulator [Sphaerochaeta pleomorpha]AEV29793.1 transcriptional regulator containing PAS, AAA-type ATPase, and DNA-binding domains [Sphaerochaeta pleomorpha str. Grapes]